MHDREIELIDYIRVLWRQKWIVLATVIAALIAAWSASQLAETYQISVSLLILPPVPMEAMDEIEPFQLTPQAYLEIARSSSVIEQARSLAESLSPVSGDSFGSRLAVTVQSLSDGAETHPQYLVTATLRDEDPDALPVMATAWIEAFSDAVVQFYRTRAMDVASYLEAAYMQAEAELQQLAEERLELLSAQSLITLQTRLGSIQSELLSVRKSLAETLSERDILTTYRSTGIADSLKIEGSAQLVVTDELGPTTLLAAFILGLPLREFESVLERRIEYLDERAAFLEAELKTKQQQIDRIEQALVLVDDKTSAMSGIANSLSSRLQIARSKVEDTSYQPLSLASPTMQPVPTRSGNLKVSLLTAGFLGLLVGILLAFFIDYLLQVSIREEAQARERSTQGSETGSDSTDEALP